MATKKKSASRKPTSPLTSRAARKKGVYRISADRAWQLVRELMFTVSQHGADTKSEEEMSNNEFERFNRRNKMFVQVMTAISEYNEWNEKYEATKVAKHAHLELRQIYERVCAGELSVDDSRPLIIEMIKGYLSVLSVGPYYHFSDEQIAKALVKSRDEISISTKKPTGGKEGAKHSITGPSSIADAALGTLLGIGYRRANNVRVGSEPDHLTFAYRYGDLSLMVPGVTDRPYSLVVETLRNVFFIKLSTAFEFAYNIGATYETFFSNDQDAKPEANALTPPSQPEQTSAWEESEPSPKTVSLPKWVLTPTNK